MRLRLVLPFALTLSATAAVLAGGGDAAPARDARVRPGIGIASVELGMTPAQVRRAMGRAQDSAWSEERSFGSRYVELVWDQGPEDYFSVGLSGRSGALRAVAIATTRPGERTPSGIGPGSTIVKLRRTIRGLRCFVIFPREGGTVIQSEYVLNHTGGRQTVFVPGKHRFYSRDTSKFVAYVTVRERGATSTAIRSVPCGVPW